MHCRDVRHHLALSVGGDHPAGCSYEPALVQHLAGCPHCQALRQRLTQGLEALHDASLLRSESVHGCQLRQKVLRQLPQTARAEQTARFNGWVPAMALAASLLMMVSVVATNRPRDNSGVDWASRGGQDRNLFVTDPNFRQLKSAEAPLLPSGGTRTVSGPPRPLLEP